MIMDTESESIVQAALDKVGTYRGRRRIILDTGSESTVQAALDKVGT